MGDRVVRYIAAYEVARLMVLLSLVFSGAFAGARVAILVALHLSAYGAAYEGASLMVAEEVEWEKNNKIVTKRFQTSYKVVTIREKRMTKFFAAKRLTFFLKYDIMEVRAFSQRTGASGPGLIELTSCPGACQKNNF